MPLVEGRSARASHTLRCCTTHAHASLHRSSEASAATASERASATDPLGFRRSSSLCRAYLLRLFELALGSRGPRSASTDEPADVLVDGEPSLLMQTLGDDPLEACSGFLAPRCLAALGRCCQRLREVSRRDTVWQPLCEARWAGRRQRRAWLDAAAAAARDAGDAVASPTWAAHYALREASMRHGRLPIFAMSAYLEVGRRTDLHFFEPRYKWLVKVACEEKGGLFVFCTAAPGAHERSAHYSWLCEAQNVHVLPDGRANLSVFPLGRCRLRRLWRENVPAAPDAPPLSFADVLEVPRPPAPAPSPRSVLRSADADDGDAGDAAAASDDDLDDDYDDSDDDDEDYPHLQPEHRRLLELLIQNPGAMTDLGLTRERVVELLSMAGAGGDEDESEASAESDPGVEETASQSSRQSGELLDV